jgi:hypothetical protein
MASFSSSKPQLRRGAPRPTSFCMFSTRPPATAAILTASLSDSTAGSTAPPGRSALANSALSSASCPRPQTRNSRAFNSHAFWAWAFSFPHGKNVSGSESQKPAYFLPKFLAS